MRKPMFALVLALALATAYAVGQSTTAAPSSGTPQATQSTPATPTTNVMQNAGTFARTSDQELERQLREQLASFPNVQASVNNGNVTLVGNVASKQDRKRVRDLARAIPGVRKVRDQLTISASAAASAPATLPSTPPAATAASDLQSKIENDLRNEPSLVNSNISVNVTATNVVLSGSVPTEVGKEKAREIAQRQAGNLIVINNLTVANLSSPAAGVTATGGVAGAAASAAQQPTTGTTATAGTVGSIAAQQPPSPGMATAGATTSLTTGASADLQSQIEKSFHQNNLTGVTVSVTDNTIELKGSVPTGKEKHQAMRLANSFAKGRRVVDHITVIGRGAGANLQKPPKQ